MYYWSKGLLEERSHQNSLPKVIFAAGYRKPSGKAPVIHPGDEPPFLSRRRGGKALLDIASDVIYTYFSGQSSLERTGIVAR